jgi:hypothetical protein
VPHGMGGNQFIDACPFCRTLHDDAHHSLGYRHVIMAFEQILCRFVDRIVLLKGIQRAFRQRGVSRYAAFAPLHMHQHLLAIEVFDLEIEWNFNTGGKVIGWTVLRQENMSPVLVIEGGVRCLLPKALFNGR